MSDLRRWPPSDQGVAGVFVIPLSIQWNRPITILIIPCFPFLAPINDNLVKGNALSSYIDPKQRLCTDSVAGYSHSGILDLSTF